jgi:hypothetical protein
LDLALTQGGVTLVSAKEAHRFIILDVLVRCRFFRERRSGAVFRSSFQLHVSQEEDTASGVSMQGRLGYDFDREQNFPKPYCSYSRWSFFQALLR